MGGGGVNYVLDRYSEVVAIYHIGFVFASLPCLGGRCFRRGAVGMHIYVCFLDSWATIVGIAMTGEGFIWSFFFSYAGCQHACCVLNVFFWYYSGFCLYWRNGMMSDEE